MLKNLIYFVLLLALISCGGENALQVVTPITGTTSATTSSGTPGDIQDSLLPHVGVASSDGSIVKSRSVLALAVGTSGLKPQVAAALPTGSSQLPISVISAPSSTVTFNTANLVVPTVTSSVLSLGNIALTQLSDNNLGICGTNGRTKCTSAVIRMYTTGVAGAGIYNTADEYGAPLNAGQTSPYATVGLSSTSAAILQTFVIPKSMHVLTASSFTNPVYAVQADFSNAGAGSYSTNLVIEYVLLP